MVADHKYFALAEDPQPYIYHPVAQGYAPRMSLLLVTTTDSRQLVETVGTLVRAIDASVAPTSVASLEELRRVPLFPLRMLSILAVISGLVALGLATIGLGAVTAYQVASRRHELSVRLALGARAAQIRELVVRQGLAVVVGGVAVGLILSIGAARGVRGLLFGVSSLDPLTFVFVAVVLLGVAWLACLFPARQATRVNLMSALRGE